MTSSAQADCDLTHAVVGYLSASYRGKLAALNALAQLRHRSFQQEELSRTQRTVETIQRWLDDLWQGMPLLSTGWRLPETFEAKRAMDLMKEMRNELLAEASKLQKMLLLQDSLNDDQNVQAAIAAFIRFAYGKDNYFQAFIEYGKIFNRPDIIEQYSGSLPETKEGLFLANSLLKEFRSSAQSSPQFLERLLDAVSSLPGVYRMNANDLGHFGSIYGEEYGYEQAGISKSEGERWLEAGVEPRQAGYWAAFEMHFDEATRWLQAGYSDPYLAGRWKIAGFSPEDSVPWQIEGIAPEIARRARLAGKTPAEIATALSDPTNSNN